MENTTRPGWIRIATVVLSTHPVTGAVTEYVRTDTIREREIAHYQEQVGNVGTRITLRSGVEINTDLPPGDLQVLIDDAINLHRAAGEK